MSLLLRSISKSFAQPPPSPSVEVIKGVDLDVANGRIVAIFGANGCGKSTLMNILAGIASPNQGQVCVTGSDDLGPILGYAFQSFNDVLLPWKSALDNIAFGLTARGISLSLAREKATSFLSQFGLELPLNHYPYKLSSGQCQVVALMRVLLTKPCNILLDEPFSALDHSVRFRMQHKASHFLLDQINAAVLLVTHDIDEALFMSDELYLLSRRPARVLHRFPVPFKRPRSHDLLLSEAFSALRRDVVAAFLKDVET